MNNVYNSSALSSSDSSAGDWYLCECVALLCCALGLAGGITQGEDDGPLVE